MKRFLEHSDEVQAMTQTTRELSDQEKQELVGLFTERDDSREWGFVGILWAAVLGFLGWLLIGLMVLGVVGLLGVFAL
jgi:hypothetical protein